MRGDLTRTIPKAVFLLAVLTACPSCSSTGLEAEFLPVTVDGDFSEWGDGVAHFRDGTADGPSEGVDFRGLWIADDAERLYLRIEVGREVIWQNETHRAAGNDMRLYLDLDSSSRTGQVIAGIGVDLEIHFGGKRVVVWTSGGSREASLNSLGMQMAPAHSAEAFEVALPWKYLGVFEKSGSSAEGKRIRFFLQELPGGDRLPDRGALTLLVRPAVQVDVKPIELDREDESNIRVLSHNVLRTGPETEPGPYRRYLRALQPDIVNFQEIWDWSEEETREFIESILAPSSRKSWFAAKADDCVTVSRWPIAARSQVDGNLLVLIDLPDKISRKNLVVFNAHTPCCGNDPGRDLEHDHMAAAWRDLLNGKGPFVIGSDDALVLTGDLNMVGFKRQLETIRDGKIIDHASFGPDFSPGRGSGSLVSAPLRHTHSRDIYTWRNDQEVYVPGKLDYILFTSDVLQLKRNFSLYTPEIPAPVLNAYGLDGRESGCSDHLVLVADFEVR